MEKEFIINITHVLIDAKDYVDLIIEFGGVPDESELELQKRLLDAIETMQEFEKELA
jgi:hypothetical protein